MTMLDVARRITRGPRGQLRDLGHQYDFYVSSARWTPKTLRRYRHEVWAILSDTAFGTAGLAVVGGTVGVMVALSYAVGTQVGLQGYAALESLGAANFAAFASAYFNTREAAPLVASSCAGVCPPR
jgi:phospholipid/cholesterol/gamma-HCH transport system permease protein